MKVNKYVLRDTSIAVDTPLVKLGYKDFVSNKDWKRNLISTTSLKYHPARKTIICGLTGFDTDILYEFDPVSKQFFSLNYASVSEQFEIKIHRSLELLGDNSIIAATAGLHREDQRYEAAGGRIFKYNFDTRSYDYLGIPVSYDYIQTITVDEKRGLIYGVTYPVFNFFVFDIKKRQTRYIHFTGSVPHIMACDDFGCVWSTYNGIAHNLFKYDPDNNHMTFFEHGLLPNNRNANILYPGASPIDSMINGNDGFIYVGLTTGELARLEPETAKVTILGKPTQVTRLAAMQLGPDGFIWGVAGFEGTCNLFKYDTHKNKFHNLGIIEDHETKTPLYIAHDMCFVSRNRVFIGETDTTDRAGYLWEVVL